MSERGPLELFDPRALTPPPRRPHFESLIADGLRDVSGLDRAAGTASDTITDGARGQRDGFEGRVDDIAAMAADPSGHGLTDRLWDSVVLGDDNDLLRQSADDTLPPLGTPIDLNIDDPPRPPGGYPDAPRPDPGDTDPWEDKRTE